MYGKFYLVCTMFLFMSIINIKTNVQNSLGLKEQWIGLLSVLRRPSVRSGSVVVDSLYIASPIFCAGFLFSPFLFFSTLSPFCVAITLERCPVALL